MTDTLAIVQHHAVEGPGRIAAWATSQNIGTVIYRADGNQLPQVGAGPYVLLGGPASVREPPHWMKSEKDWLRACVGSDASILGICLGAQLLADALGGTIERMPEAECGWQSILFDDDVRLDALTWHEDAIATPPFVDVRARSEACANQLFHDGQRRVGIQFHPEWDAPSVAAINRHFGSASPLTRMREDEDARHAGIAEWLIRTLDAWRVHWPRRSS